MCHHTTPPDSHVGSVKYGKLMLSERNVDARPDSFRGPQTLGGFTLAAVVVRFADDTVTERFVLWLEQLSAAAIGL